jgi:hypothetical protein
LFLRREVGLGRIVQGGDIDNRLKTLFDALRIPKTMSETGGGAVADDESPFFLPARRRYSHYRCQDQSRHAPDAPKGEGDDDAKLVIGVTVKPLQTLQQNSDFS